MHLSRFTWHRFSAVVVKEFIQMRRDRLTFGMMVGIPLIQLILFGFAINSDPKHLSTAVLDMDKSVFSRSFVSALQNSRYFTITDTLQDETQFDRMLMRGEVQFAVQVPPDFSRRLLRGERPALLVAADATDPAATGNALAALNQAASHALDRDLRGPLSDLRLGPGPIDLRVHRRFNPEIRTQNNIVPGLLGVVLTMTMVVITSLAITRERERGTMENLLSTPAFPGEVMFGKIVPYILVGYIQMGLILLAARYIFQVPVSGNLLLLAVVALLFIAANLSVGLTFSTLAQNQLQAVQMSFFFFLPSILLSGFMFPFRGMPVWAQWLGEVLPLTHFLRIIRGILLKHNRFADIAHELIPLGLFLVVAMTIGIKRYRQTLD